MKKNEIKELGLHIGSQVLIRGFVDSIRIQKNFIFMILRDLGAKVQVFVEKSEKNSKLVNLLSNLTQESTVEVSGMLISNPSIKLNGYEIIPESIIILSLAGNPLPIDNLATSQDR